MISVENSAALVKGAAPAATAVVKLEVVRAFCIKGVRQEVGDTVEVQAATARELMAMGKAVAYVDKPAAATRAAPKERKA